jgi:hypothetical protein
MGCCAPTSSASQIQSMAARRQRALGHGHAHLGPLGLQPDVALALAIDPDRGRLAAHDRARAHRDLLGLAVGQDVEMHATIAGQGHGHALVLLVGAPAGAPAATRVLVLIGRAQIDEQAADVELCARGLVE